MNVAHLLTAQSQTRAGAAAIVEGAGSGKRSVTFGELDTLSAKAAALLAQHGIRAGDNILILVPMSIDLYVALIAVFRTGATAVFLDPSAGLEHVKYCCEIAAPAALIAVPKAHLLRFVSPALRKIPHKFAVGWRIPGTTRWTDLQQLAPAPKIVQLEDTAPALLTFTSGSTGIPKAAVRSHGFLAAQHHALARGIDLQPGEIDLATLPIFSLTNLASGVTTIIPDTDLRRPADIDAASVLRQIQLEQPTRVVASPAFLAKLLDATPQPNALASFRHVFTGGAPIFPALLDRLQAAMPSSRIVALYGSTEAEPIAHIARSEIAPADIERMTSGGGLLTGCVVPEIDLRIVPNRFGQPIAPLTPEGFAALSLSANEPGEIVVHGDHVLTGYLHGRGDEQTKFRVADQIWHRTGDAGYLDEQSRLWLLGRAEAKIEDARGTVYPFAVEAAVSKVPGVKRCALIQHNSKRLLVVQPAGRIPRLGFEQLKTDFAWAHLDDIHVMMTLPLDKRHNAKIDYPALRKLLDAQRK